MKQDASAWVPLFPDSEIKHILSAVLRSGARLRKLDETELENDLTDRLRDELDRDRGFRARPIELFREVPLCDRKRARRRPLGRTDLIFLYSTGSVKPWPYFAIEFKRLHVTFPSRWQSLVPEYVTGHQGMMCFVEGRYADGLTSGAMVGYVFDGEVDQARAAIAASIKANKVVLKCVSDPPFRPSPVILSGVIGESVHSRSNSGFTIYHVFLAV